MYLPVKGHAYDWAYYVPRSRLPAEDVESEIVRKLGPGTVSFLYGPPGCGKTSLLWELVHRLKDEEPDPQKLGFAYLSLQDSFRRAGSDPVPLLHEIASEIELQVHDRELPRSLLKDQADVPWTVRLKQWLARHIAPRDHELEVVLAFDCPATKDGSPLQRDLYRSMIRWPEDPRMHNVRILVAHTTTYSDSRDYIEDLADNWLPRVPDLTEEQVRAFVRRFGAWDDTIVAELFGIVGGHARLWTLIVQAVHRDGLPAREVVELARCGAAPFAPFFQGAFSDLPHHPKCLAVLRSLVGGTNAELDPDVVARLTWAGLLKSYSFGDRIASAPWLAIFSTWVQEGRTWK